MPIRKWFARALRTLARRLDPPRAATPDPAISPGPLTLRARELADVMERARQAAIERRDAACTWDVHALRCVLNLDYFNDSPQRAERF